MAKARAIVKRRKAVRNIRKITKTMQMIATAKFQKSLKRAVGTKPYTMKVRELVREMARSVGNVSHPLLRQPSSMDRSNRVAVVVITSNRGLAGAYNSAVLRMAGQFLRQQEAAGQEVELHLAGKKGATFFTYQKRSIAQRYDQLTNELKFDDVDQLADRFIADFVAGKIDAVHIVYMNFVSTGVQKPDVMTLLPLAGAEEAAEKIAAQLAEKEAAAKVMQERGLSNISEVMEEERKGDRTEALADAHVHDTETVYDFSPSPADLLDELLPLTVKTALFQTFLDATTSEHVARMVAMKSATDNADKMARALTMQYNRARQSQITTELSEIMGGVEAMGG